MSTQEFVQQHLPSHLRLLRCLTSRLPPVRGVGVLISRLAEHLSHDFRTRGDQSSSTIFQGELHGRQAVFNARDFFQLSLLLAPQLNDAGELRRIAKYVRPGMSIVDIGANVGFYTTFFAGLVAPTGRVLAIEANPTLAEILRENARLNGRGNIIVKQLGIADKECNLLLSLPHEHSSVTGTFARDATEGIAVDCKPLLDVLNSSDYRTVDLLKIDIEGFEKRVLDRFFHEADKSIWPAAILTEQTEKYLNLGNDIVGTLKEASYVLEWRRGVNFFFRKG